MTGDLTVGGGERESRDSRSAPAGAGAPTVVLLHGILLNRWFFEPLAMALRRRGYRVLNFSYPSTRCTIREHAALLAPVLEQSLPAGGGSAVSFVTHSLGGLIARRMLSQPHSWKTRRLLQIVPPNRGSAVARELRDKWWYRWLYGTRAGLELALPEEELRELVGEIPADLEIGIIAGSAPPPPLRALAGAPSDGTVLLSEAALPGVPLCVLPASHTLILWTPRLWREVLSFLECGVFTTPSDEGAVT